MRDRAFRHGRQHSRGGAAGGCPAGGRGAAGVLLLLGTIVVIRTATFHSRQVRASPAAIAAASHEPVDVRGMAEHLGQAVRFQTVSYQDPARFDAEAFRGMHGYLEATYPKLHATLKREARRGLQPALHVGRDRPVAAAGAAPGAPGRGAGRVAAGVATRAVRRRGGRRRGLGTRRGGLQGVADRHARGGRVARRGGFRPRRTVLLRSGTTRRSAAAGARAIAALLERRGVRLEFVLDEGGAITSGIVRGIDRPVAAVGIAEKGYVTLELHATTDGGHSSMPPAHTAAGVLAAAIARLEDDPFPASVNDVTRQTLDYLGPEMSLPRRMALANLWLFGPVVRRQFLGAPATAAMLRTTTAVTMLRAGVKENVLPADAAAVVNFRIIPGETTDSVTERVRATIADDRVQVRPFGDVPAADPSAVSDPASPGFQLVQQTLAEVAPDAVVAPTLSSAAPTPTTTPASPRPSSASSPPA